MSRRKKLTFSGLALAVIAGVSIGWTMSFAQQQEGPAVETLLPATAVVYVGFDGNLKHEEAWENTAAHDAIYKTGLMDVVEKLIGFAGEQLRQQALQGGGGAEDAEQLKQAKQIYDMLMNNGMSVTISVEQGAPGGPPIPKVYGLAVMHNAGSLTDGMTKLSQAVAQQEGLQLNERNVDGRKVVGTLIPDTPNLEVSWWNEQGHLVIGFGMQPAESAIAVASGNAPNITTSKLWKKYKSEDVGFEVAFTGWFDFGTLRNLFGGMPIPMPQQDPNQPPVTVSQVLETLGLDTMGAIVCRTGYQGKATWSKTIVEAPAPRKGLLAIADQEAISLDDLPPLPFEMNGFHASSFDASAFYDTVLTLVRGIAAMGPPEAGQQVEGMIQQLPQMIGFDLKQDLLDSLGNVHCVYGDKRQGLFGMGVAMAIEVKDADKLKNTLNQIAGMVAEEAPPGEFDIRRTVKHGREIVTLEFGGGVFNPAYVVDKDWFVVGLFPQTVEAFIMRLDGNLTSWRPSRSYQQAFGELPQKFTSMTATDPRKSYRMLMQFAPLLMSGMQAGMREELGPDVQLPVTVADLPPAEAVARPLFPNISVGTVDENGITIYSRNSLPGVPLLGMGDGSSVATVGVMTALLLPAVQQARTAARRTQSKNNLRQIALGCHNFHDAHRLFPPGNIVSQEVAYEKRLSWLATTLPYMEMQFLYQELDFKKPVDDESNADAAETHLEMFVNPGVPDNEPGTTHYVGIGGLGNKFPIADPKKVGIFGGSQACRIRDIIDGTSNTFMVSEASGKYGSWAENGMATIRGFSQKPYINGPDGIGGPYPGGVNIAFADGSVRFISEDVDGKVVEGGATRAGGEAIDWP